jgi:prephenate dehydratase
VGGKFTPLPCATFVDTVRAVTELGADYAVIPVHNAIAGPVDAALDAIGSTTQLEEVKDYMLPVQLALLGLPDSSVGQIREVLSHEMALKQCKLWCAAHPLIRVVEAYDTAGAARMVALRRDHHAAAIAAPWAAAHYGLVILEEGLQDRSDNLTRFLLLRRKPFARLGAVPS